jgi:hydroxyacylglutathione hydrolase
MYIEQLYTTCLAEAAYYIESEGEAAIIDPLRETEPYLELAKKRGTTIKYVFETHFHADFVSGHIDLSKKAGAPIVYGPLANTDYPVINATDGQEFSLGKLTIKVVHTPGHTPESSCFLLLDENKREHAIFTGDTLFVGDVGRPDLLDGIMTREELASMLFDSLTKKIKCLPDNVLVYPAHGAGSACGKNIGKETFSTIGDQKKLNYALQEQTREEFIKAVTDGILPPPAYFFEDARINRMGYNSIDEVMMQNSKPLSLEAFKQAIVKGALLLDTRKPDDFEKGYIPSSLNIGLNGQYAVWIGTIIDIKQPLVLITEEGNEDEAVLRLARVGYENVHGYLVGGIKTWDGTLDKVRSITAEAINNEMKNGTPVLDVRRPGEWEAGHLKAATFVPLAKFPNVLDTLDKQSPYLVHCAGGYRSMIAISLMRRAGFTGDLVNVYGGYGAIQQTDLEKVAEVACTAYA